MHAINDYMKLPAFSFVRVAVFVLVISGIVSVTVQAAASLDRTAAPTPVVQDSKTVTTTADREPYDLLFLNARVIDGTGNPWYYSDIGIKGGRIVSMGVLEDKRAQTIIDLQGRYLAPGFIDVHSHASGGLINEELSAARALLAQGITTVVINPDGGGPTDLTEQRARLLEYGLGVNAARFVPHGSIRREVIGNDDRAPSANEIETMKRLVRAGMEEGAVGLSTGLFYAPASFADTEEIIELAHVVGEYNGLHQSHIRDESDYTIGVEEAVEEIIRISREASIPGVVTHIKALGPNVWGASVPIIQRIREARDNGVEIFADQYPYHASATSLSAALVPRWATAGGRDAFLERVDDPETRTRILQEMEENLVRRGGAERISMRYVEHNSSLDALTLQEISERLDTPPVEAALVLLKEGSPGIVSFNMNENDIRRFMQQSWTMTSSDGGLGRKGEGVPHPRNYGSFARKIHLYVVEEEIVDLAFAIRSMTSLSATVHRIPDRGLIRPGMVADLVVFTPGEVRDRATFTEPHQLSEGFWHVLVNGSFAIYQGRFTGRLHGTVLDRADRHPDTD